MNTVKFIWNYLLLLLGFCFLSEPSLAEVTTSVTSDGLVRIVYTLEANDPSNAFPVFSVKFTGELYGGKSFVLKTLDGSGKTGLAFFAGEHTTFWDIGKDKPKFDPANVKINVEAVDVTDMADYLCLDLKKFKMRYQKEAPKIKNSKCKTKELWLKRIEPDSFAMGSQDDEVGRSDDEIAREIMLQKPYYLAIFETTQGQFKNVTGYCPEGVKGNTRAVAGISFNMLRGDGYGSEWRSSYNVDADYNYYPTFFNVLREKTGNDIIFDLPTEAQWEYACRAGTDTSLNNGSSVQGEEEDENLDRLGWYNANSYDKKVNGLAAAPVGMKKPNAWGLYDMHGNVWEWCLDWYDIYEQEASIDPLGPFVGSKRVVRGGGFDSPAKECRSARRCYSEPGNAANNYGFRVGMFPSLNKRVFKYSLTSDYENALSVFRVSFTLKASDGTKYKLEKLGKSSGDGITGIVLGSGEHMLLLEFKDKYANLFNDLKLIVDSEDITQIATYLVLDLETFKMRAESNGPKEKNYILGSDACRTYEFWFRRIEPGTFVMGAPEDELGRVEDEVKHQVTLTAPFYIGVFETTQKQYEYITGYNPAYPYFVGDSQPVENVSYNMIRGSVLGADWPKDHRVDKMFYSESQENKPTFLYSFREKTGNGLIFDLPTEAQWEYACRAGKNTALNDGHNLSDSDKDESLDKLGRYLGNGLAPRKGGFYLPNAWGLYDMHGNVWEWCLDWYDDYHTKAVKDPTGPESGEKRVLRGGCFEARAFACRSAYRRSRITNIESYYNGFRVVLIK